MATTNTVSSPQAGVTVYSFTALASGDSYDFPGEFTNATEILFQATGGTFSSTVVAPVGSLDGTNFAPLFTPGAIITGFAVENAVQAGSANAAIWRVQPTRYLRLTATGGTGTGITCNVVVKTL